MPLTAKTTKILQETKAYIVIALGLLMYSFAWTTLLIPAKVVGGGVGGMGTLIYYATGETIPVGVSYLVINGLFLLLGFLIIGPKFGAKTIFAILFNSLALTIMQENIPVNLMGLAGDKLLSAILGGALAGAGVGICFTQGGSSGGTDIIAMIINRYRNVSLGKLIMMMDVIIVGSSYLVFKDLPTIVYGYVTMSVLGYTIDMVLSGSKSSSQIMIFSPQYSEIAKRIISEANRGVTFLDAEGGYSRAPQKVVTVVCRRSEQSTIFRIVKEVDPDAFITVGSVMGVYGKGFEALRAK